MRGWIVAGMMVAAGAAGAQDKNWKPIVESVAKATAGAPVCNFAVSVGGVDSALKSSGFDRANPSHAAALDSDFQHQSNLWFVQTQSAAATPSLKANIAIECERLWTAFGPDGVIRKGLLSKK